MNFEEHAAKPRLAEVGIQVPAGELADTPDAAAAEAGRLGPCVVKAQVPTGKRGKAGGIALAKSPVAAATAAARILGMEIAGHRVEKVLVEAQVPIVRELYAAVLNDPASKGTLVLFSPEGGMDIEEIAATHLGREVSRRGIQQSLGRLVAPPKRKSGRERGRLPWLARELREWRRGPSLEHLELELLPRIREVRRHGLPQLRHALGIGVAVGAVA